MICEKCYGSKVVRKVIMGQEVSIACLHCCTSGREEIEGHAPSPDEQVPEVLIEQDSSGYAKEAP